MRESRGARYAAGERSPRPAVVLGVTGGGREPRQDGPAGAREAIRRPGCRGTAPVLEASGHEIPRHAPAADLLSGLFERPWGPSRWREATPPPRPVLCCCHVFATSANVAAPHRCPSLSVRQPLPSCLLIPGPSPGASCSPGPPRSRSFARRLSQSADVLPWWMRRSAGAHAAPCPGVLARARIRSPAGGRARAARPLGGRMRGSFGRSGGPWSLSQASLPAPPGRPICHGRHPIILPRRRGALSLLWTERGRETVLAWGGAGRPESPGDRLRPSSPRWVPLPLVAPAPRAQLPVLAFWGFRGSWGFPRGSTGKESTCNAGDPGSIPGLGRSAGEGIG